MSQLTTCHCISTPALTRNSTRDPCRVTFPLQELGPATGLRDIKVTAKLPKEGLVEPAALAMLTLLWEIARGTDESPITPISGNTSSSPILITLRQYKPQFLNKLHTELIGRNMPMTQPFRRQTPRHTTKTTTTLWETCPMGSPRKRTSLRRPWTAM